MGPNGPHNISLSSLVLTNSAASVFCNSSYSCGYGTDCESRFTFRDLCGPEQNQRMIQVLQKLLLM